MPKLPDKWISKLESLSQFLIIWSMITLALETEPDMMSHKMFFDISEKIVITFFTCEYLIRLSWAEKKWKYVFSLNGIIDLLAILPSLVAFGAVDLRTLRVCRLLRILRIGKLYRYNTAFTALIQALKDIKDEMVIALGMGFFLIYLSSLGIYHFEHESQPENFGTISSCFWWSIVSLTTVGYGDAFPVTSMGRIFTSLILIIGIGIISLPPALIASALLKNHFQKSKDTYKLCSPCHSCTDEVPSGMSADTPSPAPQT